MRNTDWSRQFIGDVARLGRMHVNHWQLMDEVMHRPARCKVQILLLLPLSSAPLLVTQRCHTEMCKSLIAKSSARSSVIYNSDVIQTSVDALLCVALDQFKFL